MQADRKSKLGSGLQIVFVQVGLRGQLGLKGTLRNLGCRQRGDDQGQQEKEQGLYKAGHRRGRTRN